MFTKKCQKFKYGFKIDSTKTFCIENTTTHTSLPHLSAFQLSSSSSISFSSFSSQFESFHSKHRKEREKEFCVSKLNSCNINFESISPSNPFIVINKKTLRFDTDTVKVDLTIDIPTRDLVCLGKSGNKH